MSDVAFTKSWIDDNPTYKSFGWFKISARVSIVPIFREMSNDKYFADVPLQTSYAWYVTKSDLFVVDYDRLAFQVVSFYSEYHKKLVIEHFGIEQFKNFIYVRLPKPEKNLIKGIAYHGFLMDQNQLNPEK